MEEEILKEAIVEVLGVYINEIEDDMTFTGDLSADSLDVYQIVLIVEDKLNIELKEEDIYEVKTVGQALELIKKAVKENE
ncbi:MAG: acyl carrier protein [Lachnospiraceae bacterium]|jgi:acyl carrier protein|nr:acyl carrier protein [Lachnospiraceae bacterium]